MNQFENFYVGQLPGLPIFNLYDNVFRERSFLVIDQSDIAGVLEIDEGPDDNYNVIEHIRSSFVDFRDKPPGGRKVYSKLPRQATSMK